MSATIRHTCLALGAMIALLGPSGPGLAQSDAQRNAVENIAQAIAGTNLCSRYRPNLPVVTLLSLRYGMRLDQPFIHALLEERTRFHAERIKGRTPDDICGALLRLFGPEGSNVKNLVAPA